MDTDTFRLSDSYDYEGGADNSLDSFANKLVGQNYMAAFVLIIILILVVFYFVWITYFSTESFSPTSTKRFQWRDGMGESMSAGAGVLQTTSPYGQLGQPLAINQQILSSPDFDCSNRNIQPGQDAWTWMVGQSKENMVPRDDNDFSKILAGY